MCVNVSVKYVTYYFFKQAKTILCKRNVLVASILLLTLRISFFIKFKLKNSIQLNEIIVTRDGLNIFFKKLTLLH